MTIWFTSDLHFGHANIITYCRRPFHSVDNMNKLLIMQWNEVVADDDTVYVLGDVALGKMADTLPLCSQLKGTKKLVPGNHDRCWTGHRKAGGWKERYEEVGFEILPNQVDFELDFTLCHFPYAGDSQAEDRYVEHRPIDTGRILLHGHVHDAWKAKDNMINVGVDVWGYYPVSLDDILRYFIGGA